MQSGTEFHDVFQVELAVWNNSVSHMEHGFELQILCENFQNAEQSQIP